MMAALELQLWGGMYWASGNRLACRARQTPPGDCHSISSTVLLWLCDRLCSSNRNNLCNYWYLFKSASISCMHEPSSHCVGPMEKHPDPQKMGSMEGTSNNRHLMNLNGKSKRKMRGITSCYDFKSKDMKLLEQETESGSSQPWYK